MTRRKMKVSDLPPESIGSVSTLDEADMIFKRIFSTRPPATIKDIPPRGWARVKWFTDRVFFREATL
jgi:hypothetical protein